ncbi:MAG: 2-phospho-L-lactate transferase [Kiritimatiellae bacterium]|nr:2-phospho-L-lactate transferase [Kiritimatiellia bacterium]
MNPPKNITILAGGIGGSKIVEGFARLHDQHTLTVIGNTGDDIERHGLWVSPDMDIITYSLAHVVDREKGWGFKNETFQALRALGELGEEVWMNLGDQDLATHIYRTHLRRQGLRPTDIALKIAEKLGVTTPILVPTDDVIQTMILTEKGWLNFQEFYVREKCEREVLDIDYHGAQQAKPTPEVLDVLSRSDLMIIAPSNPLGSIGPILAIPGIREALIQAPALKIAVSPIVGGLSLKGPAHKMLSAKGYTVDPLGVAGYYSPLIQGIVIDTQDKKYKDALEDAGLEVYITDTIMKTQEDKERVAGSILP